MTQRFKCRPPNGRDMTSRDTKALTSEWAETSIEAVNNPMDRTDVFILDHRVMVTSKRPPTISVAGHLPSSPPSSGRET